MSKTLNRRDTLKLMGSAAVGSQLIGSIPVSAEVPIRSAVRDADLRGIFVILSTVLDAPLLNQANLDVTPNPSKAAWYLVALQELLLHMNPALAGVIVPPPLRCSRRTRRRSIARTALLLRHGPLPPDVNAQTSRNYR